MLEAWLQHKQWPITFYPQQINSEVIKTKPWVSPSHQAHKELKVFLGLTSQVQIPGQCTKLGIQMLKNSIFLSKEQPKVTIETRPKCQWHKMLGLLEKFHTLLGTWFKPLIEMGREETNLTKTTLSISRICGANWIKQDQKWNLKINPDSREEMDLCTIPISKEDFRQDL